MGKIIQRERSIIPACDVTSLEELEKIVKETCDIEGIGGYKVGFSLALRYGLPAVVKTAKKAHIKTNNIRSSKSRNRHP